MSDFESMSYWLDRWTKQGASFTLHWVIDVNKFDFENVFTSSPFQEMSSNKQV